MPLNTVYLENCGIADKHLSQVLDLLGEQTRIREIHIVRMNIMPLTKKSIFLLLKGRAQQDFRIFFREAPFVDMYNSNKKKFWHPLLS